MWLERFVQNRIIAPFLGMVVFGVIAIIFASAFALGKIMIKVVLTILIDLGIL